MAINEVFNHPTIKQVVFQVRFPNLFFLENKIGDLQVAIMKQFPESKLLFRKQFIFADVGPEAKLEEAAATAEPESTTKIWSFQSPDGVKLNVLSSSIDLSSDTHKSYSNPSAKARFRDTVAFVVTEFIALTNLPLFTRVGLRYVDECPLFEDADKALADYYRSSLPLARFSAASAQEMQVIAIVDRSPFTLRYVETLKEIEGEKKLFLDFDCFAKNVKAEDLMTVTDNLHLLSSEEYDRSITDRLKDFMRQ